MKLGSFFIKRPVMTTMLFAGVSLFGILSWLQLPQELFPNIAVPQLVILTRYANAAPEDIENLITKPVEEAVGTVANLKRVKSISKEGLSVVMLNFRWGTDMGFAHLATREKIDRMKDRLPQDAEESVIKRVNPFSHPMLILSVTAPIPLQDMTDICNDVIKKKLEKTEGVAAVTISGGQKREILVQVDRGRLQASRISLPMVVDAIKNANYDYPAGVTQGKVVEYLVRTHGRFKTIDDIGKTIVQVENPEFDPVYKWKKREDKDHGSAPREQRLISLGDMAEISSALQDKTSYSRYNAKENISISIQKQADANTVDVSKNVKAAVKELKNSLPSNLKIELIYDESNYIQDSLFNMAADIVVGGLLAFVILFFFLGNIRDSLFAGLSIPVAMLATFVMMFISGYSINMLTLAGIALSVGSMSDCAICMSENITRIHKSSNQPLQVSAIMGSDEMVGPMLSSTLTNVAVFLPLLFVSGIAQQLFQGLFVVTIFTNFTSLFVSLTLIPRMAAYEWTIPGLKKAPKWVDRFMLTDQKLEKYFLFYRRTLNYVLSNPKNVFIGLTFLLGIAVFAIIITPKIFLPRMDQGQFIAQLNMPIGTRLDITNDMAQKLENIFSGFKGVNVTANIGSAQEDEDIDALQPHQAQLVVNIDLDKGMTTNEVIEKFKTYVAKENLEGGRISYILLDSPLRSALAGGAPVEVEIKGPDLEKLKFLSDSLVKDFSQNPHLFSVQTSFSLPSKETQVIPDKDQAAGFQLSVADIAKTALIAIKGMVASTFKEGGKETDIRVRLRHEDREDAMSIRQLALRSPQGAMVPLDAVAQIKSGLGNSEIRHLDQQRAVIVTAEVSNGSVSDAIKEVEKYLIPLRAYKDYSIELGGEGRQVAESFGTLRYTFILAILLVYMIMAAQFENLRQPLIIMATVPLSIIGVALTIFVKNTPFSSVVVLGVVILSGIVVNNGIVLIDRINQLLDEGVELREAVIAGCITRLRPILMTSLVTIMGVLPMALGIGRGDELAQPLAEVTFGGLFVSTLLTLLVIPMLYFLYADKKKQVAPHA